MRGNAHHVTFDKVKPERHLLNALVKAVHTLFGIREDNVGFLVVACQHALFPHPKEAFESAKQTNKKQERKGRWGNEGNDKKIRNDYSASVLENKEHAAYS